MTIELAMIVEWIENPIEVELIVLYALCINSKVLKAIYLIFWVICIYQKIKECEGDLIKWLQWLDTRFNCDTTFYINLKGISLVLSYIISHFTNRSEWNMVEISSVGVRKEGKELPMYNWSVMMFNNHHFVLFQRLHIKEIHLVHYWLFYPRF